MPQFTMTTLLLLTVFQHHANANVDLLSVNRKIIRKNNHSTARIYFIFNNAVSALKLAEMLVKATLNVHTDNSELKKLRESLDKKLSLTTPDERDIFNLNVYFNIFADKLEEIDGFDFLNNIYNKLENICENEKKEVLENICENEKECRATNEFFSTVNICIVAKHWLKKIIDIYSSEYKVRLKKFNAEYNKKVKNSSNYFLRLLNHVSTPPTKEEKTEAEAILLEHYKENAITIAKELYYKIYKHALAYVLISKGMPEMSKLKSVKVLTLHNSKMSKKQYLIYWLNAILKQMNKNFEFRTFDPIKEKEENVDMSKLKVALDRYNKPNGSEFAKSMAAKLAAYAAHHDNSAEGNANVRK